MNAPVDVVVHDLSHKTVFNDGITEILSLLERPLPLQNLNKAKLLPMFPRDFQHQIDATCAELSTSDVPFQSDCGRPGSSRPVTDVLDVILTSVLSMRASRQCLHGFADRKSNWVAMLSACGLAMAEAVVCSDDIGFARARTRSNTDVVNHRDFERKATIAMSVVLPRTLRHCSNDVVPDSTADEDSGSTSDACHDSYITMDLPLDAHITPARGKRVDCILPVVFAARAREMQELMTSLVCQRCVMGILTPVVGISLPEEGTYASLALGWSNASNPRLVHIARPLPLHPPVPASELLPIGVFDGSNPISTLRLAQFVLDLEPYFASVKAHALKSQVQDFCWRLDHARFEHPHMCNSKPDKATSPHDDTRRIRDWQATLQFADTPEPHFPLEIFDLAEAFLVAEHIALTGAPIVHEVPASSPTMSETSGTRRSSRLQSLSASLPTPQNMPSGVYLPTIVTSPPPSSKASDADQLDSKAEQGDANKSDAGKSEAARSDSASKYAKPDPKDPRGLVEWTRERETILLFLIPLSLNSSATGTDRQINEMISLYDRVTQFTWPEHWNSLDDLPSCDPAVNTVRQALYDAYQCFRITHTDVPTSQDADPTVLSLGARFSVLLNVVACAAAACSNSRDGVHIESATRSAWDQFLRLLCCQASEVTSGTYFIERTVQLPANKAAQKGEDFPALDIVELACQLASEQYTRGLKERHKGLSAVTLVLAKQALDQASTDFNTVNDNPGRVITLGDRVKDPPTARIDGVYCLRYNPHPILKGLPMVASSQTTTKDKAKSTPAKKLSVVVDFMSPFIRFFHLTPKLSKAPSSCREPAAKSSQRNLPQHSETPSQASLVASSTPSPKVPHGRCFICPEVARSLQADRPFVDPKSLGSKDDIFIPFLFAEYKRDTTAIQQAFNQMKLYFVSGLEFLASIGITDFPVWGIVCAGSEGVILMAWKSTQASKEDTAPNEPRTHYNFIFDSNLKRFNLTDPLQALHFYFSAHRIYQMQDKLKERLNGLDVSGALANPKFNDWMMVVLPKSPKPPKSPPADIEK